MSTTISKAYYDRIIARMFDGLNDEPSHATKRAYVEVDSEGSEDDEPSTKRIHFEVESVESDEDEPVRPVRQLNHGFDPGESTCPIGNVENDPGELSCLIEIVEVESDESDEDEPARSTAVKRLPSIIPAVEESTESIDWDEFAKEIEESFEDGELVKQVDVTDTKQVDVTDTTAGSSARLEEIPINIEAINEEPALIFAVGIEAVFDGNVKERILAVEISSIDNPLASKAEETLSPEGDFIDLFGVLESELDAYLNENTSTNETHNHETTKAIDTSNIENCSFDVITLDSPDDDFFDMSRVFKNELEDYLDESAYTSKFHTLELIIKSPKLEDCSTSQIIIDTPYVEDCFTSDIYMDPQEITPKSINVGAFQLIEDLVIDPLQVIRDLNTEINSPEEIVSPEETSPPEINSPEINSPEINSPEINSPEIKFTDRIKKITAPETLKLIGILKTSKTPKVVRFVDTPDILVFSSSEAPSSINMPRRDSQVTDLSDDSRLGLYHPDPEILHTRRDSPPVSTLISNSDSNIIDITQTLSVLFTDNLESLDFTNYNPENMVLTIDVTDSNWTGRIREIFRVRIGAPVWTSIHFVFHISDEIRMIQFERVLFELNLRMGLRSNEEFVVQADIRFHDGSVEMHRTDCKRLLDLSLNIRASFLGRID